MPSPSRARRKPKLTPFTVDELLDNPAMSGFVSFLDVRPDARTAPPQPIESEPVSSSLPDSTLPPDGTVLPVGMLPAGGTVPPERTLPSDGTILSGSNLPPEVQLLPGSNLPPDSISQPERDFLPERSFPPASTLHTAHSTLPPGSNLPPVGTLPPAGTFLTGRSQRTAGDLQTPNGRVVRIRQARTVQDAHTPAENALFQILWEKGTGETPQYRLIKAGLADISRWTGAHKTSCRDYLRALILKLAIEEAETFNASAGKEGARVYRIYSADAILERRRRAGFTHVIRTGAVTFVDPATGRKLLPDGYLLPGGNLPPV